MPTKIEWTENVWNPIVSGLEKPLKRRKPTVYFVNTNKGDLFHEDVPLDWLFKVFGIMCECPQHHFLLLTKQAERMQFFIRAVMTDRVDPFLKGQPLDNAGNVPLPNVGLGVSVKNASEECRIKTLQETPAAMRFISYEPALGPVRFEPYIGYYHCRYCGHRGHQIGGVQVSERCGITHDICPDCGEDGPLGPINQVRHLTEGQIHWVIAGGESGPDARPAHPDWFRRVRDDCAEAEVPFFFKQWGEWSDGSTLGEFSPDAMETYKSAWVGRASGCNISSPPAANEGFDWEQMFRIGKKTAGRLLDGHEYNERPEWWFAAKEGAC